MDEPNTTINMNNVNTQIVHPITVNADGNLNSEEGDKSDIVTFLNSETPELRLDFDSNDVSAQNLSTCYHTEDDIISLSNADPNQLFISHFNIRSLNKNFDKFHLFSNRLNYDHSIIGLSETWLKETSPSSLFSMDGFNLITKNRTSKKGGGVGFYVTNNLDYTLLEEYSLMTETFESIFIEIKTRNNGNIIVGELYRPPNANPVEFVELLHDLLSNNYFTNKTCFVMGDFNINLLNCNDNPLCQDFLNLMLSKSFIPLTRKPTRITDVASTLIDNIFVNNAFCDISSGIIVSDLSDHFPIYASISGFVIGNKSRQTVNPSIRVMSESNLNRLRERLGSVDWSSVYNQRNIDSSFDIFLDILTTNYNSTIPLQKPNRSNYKKVPRQPWITQSLLGSINRKNNLFHKYRKDPSTSNKSRYMRYRNILTSSIRLAKQSYFSRQFCKYKYDVKSTWKVINEALKTKTDNVPPKHILKDGLKVDDPPKIAEAFNDFFVNLGPNLADQIPNSNTDFHTFLRNRNSQSLFFAPVVEEEIKDIVSNLNNKKSSGYDGITNFLLKNVINEIISPLTYILNKSLTSGKVPLKMKIARVVPIFKKGQKDSVNNYRPISLLTSISKILEKLVYTRTIKFIVNCKILSDSQFGFRKQHNTTHALLTFIDKVAHAIDDVSHTIGVFLDFSKAFDTIDHEILLYKLSHYGIRGRALEWFKDYLADRKQFVSIHGHDSHLKSISCGVPQGSLLGPLLFILYINDLQNSSDLLSFICFADDSNLFLSHRDPNTLITKMNRELKLVQSWIHANKLSLNIEKTHYMIFSNTLRVLPDSVKINDINLLQVDNTKFLGLYIDRELSWKTHISYLSKILSRNTGILNKLKHYFPCHILQSIYSTLISPYLNYGILAWGNANKLLLDALFRIQKRAVRNINHAGFLSHTNHLFHQNRILKLTDLFHFNVGIFMFQLSNNELPDVFLHMFRRNRAIHDYPTRQRDAYHLPRTRTLFAKRTIMFTGPRYWNDLPEEISHCLSLFSFKRKFKEFLLNEYNLQTH